MLITIPRAVSNRQLSDVQSDVLPWANKEALPLFGDMRSALNQDGRAVFTVTTKGDGVSTPIWTSDDMPTGAVWFIQTRTVGVSSDAAKVAVYWKSAAFVNAAGVVSQVGTTTTHASYLSAGGPVTAFSVAGKDVVYSVQDDGVTGLAWTTQVIVLSS